jgi:hypothetical protein
MQPANHLATPNTSLFGYVYFYYFTSHSKALGAAE